MTSTQTEDEIIHTKGNVFEIYFNVSREVWLNFTDISEESATSIYLEGVTM